MTEEIALEIVSILKGLGYLLCVILGLLCGLVLIGILKD